MPIHVWSIIPTILKQKLSIKKLFIKYLSVIWSYEKVFKKPENYD